MGLFGSKKTKVSKKLQPKVITTRNVAKELLTIAKSDNIEIQLLDFNVLFVHTYTRMVDTPIDWEEYPMNELSNIKKSTFMNKNFEIKQNYEVEIFLKNDDNDRLKNFKVAIYTNVLKSKMYLKIEAGSKIEYYNHLEEDLYELVNKSKVRAGVLVHLFDEIQKTALDKLVADIKKNKKMKYEKAQVILVSESYEPIPTIDDKLIFYFENTQELDEDEKRDHTSRDFIRNAQVDAVLIEYIKPKNGKAGRDCHGKYVDFHEAIQKNEPKFEVDESIKVLEEENSILYIATCSGYIEFENNTYSIAKDKEVCKIDFKTTGNIKSGVDSEITLNVKENDVMQDAVGEGMKVEVTEIDINGNIGSNAVVQAKRAIISGQTHKTSVLDVEDLKIERHMGIANGKNIAINKLECGIVNAQDVEIAYALGGEIRGDSVKIDTCMSNVKVTSSKKIEIDRLVGSENIFIIDPLITKTLNKNFEENEKEILKLKKDVDKLKDEIEKYKDLVKKSIPVFNDIKKRLVYYKEKNITAPKSIIRKYMELLKNKKHLESIIDTHDKEEDRYTLLTTSTASFQDNIFNARIINRGEWTEHNELIFKLIDPPVEVSFKPKEGSADKIFGVFKVEDEKFEIRAVKE